MSLHNWVPVVWGYLSSHHACYPPNTRLYSALKQSWAICSSQLWNIFSRLYATTLLGEQRHLLLCPHCQILFLLQDARRILAAGRVFPSNSLVANLDTWCAQSLCDVVLFAPNVALLNLFPCLPSPLGCWTTGAQQLTSSISLFGLQQGLRCRMSLR